MLKVKDNLDGLSRGLRGWKTTGPKCQQSHSPIWWSVGGTYRPIIVVQWHHSPVPPLSRPPMWLGWITSFKSFRLKNATAWNLFFDPIWESWSGRGNVAVINIMTLLYRLLWGCICFIWAVTLLYLLFIPRTFPKKMDCTSVLYKSSHHVCEIRDIALVVSRHVQQSLVVFCSFGSREMANQKGIKRSRACNQQSLGFICLWAVVLSL